MTEFDDNHHPVPTVDFDYGQVGRALGDLDTETETLSKVLVAAEVMGRFFEIIMEDMESVPRVHRNQLIRMRLEVIAYTMRIHPDSSIPLACMSRKRGFCETSASRFARKLKLKFSMPTQVLSAQGSKRR